MRGRLRQVAASLQAAIRFRRFSRRDSHPPDWFVDKSHQDENADAMDTPEPTCWGHRIVVDPALPSYYKVHKLFSHFSPKSLTFYAGHNRASNAVVRFNNYFN
mgnify:FL=1